MLKLYLGTIKQLTKKHKL